jgi:hypothetical protein
VSQISNPCSMSWHSCVNCSHRSICIFLSLPKHTDMFKYICLRIAQLVASDPKPFVFHWQWVYQNQFSLCTTCHNFLQSYKVLFCCH